MKIFYDLGSHLFDGLEKFNNAYNFDKSWKIYSFEANPYTFKAASQKRETEQWLRDLDIEMINAAISDTNGTTNFECYFDNNHQSYVDVGSTAFDLRNNYFKEIHKDSTYAQLGDEYCKVEVVPTVCFSEFIDKHTNYGDEVIVKMDIEGSEFKTLSRMISDNTHTLVKTMYIEWHERFWPNESEKYNNWKNQILFKLANDRVDAKIWW